MSFVHSSVKRDGDRIKGDFYATDPIATEKLLNVEPDLDNIWECACGEGHLAKVFDIYGKLGKASDLYDRGYGEKDVDFLKMHEKWNGDIVTNPPYKLAKEFILKALELCEDERKVCMFLPIQYVESLDRYKNIFSKYPPYKIYPFVKRVNCGMNGDLSVSSLRCYAWFVWKKGFYEKTEMEWLL